MAVRNAVRCPYCDSPTCDWNCLNRAYIHLKNKDTEIELEGESTIVLAIIGGIIGGIAGFILGRIIK